MFQPGQSGNPGGKPKERPFRDALMIAIKEAEGDRTKLRRIAQALADKALEGDVAAIKEVADRLDGKVPQAQILQGDEDGGAIRLATVRYEIADAHDSNCKSIPAFLATEPV